MKQVRQVSSDVGGAAATLTLSYDRRKKSRQAARLDDGTEIAIVLARGTVLREGDILEADDGLLIEVKAAPETLSSVSTADGLLLSRAAYHLGNRHVPLEITPGTLRYQHDHVLDGMVRALGLTVTVVQAPFNPEGGAYAHEKDGHRHEHEREHEHG